MWFGKNAFFTHIFMDEAGASSVPEALVGIMGIKSYPLSCDIVRWPQTIGTHLEVGTSCTARSKVIIDNCNYDHNLQVCLKRNFHSLYNHLYYSDELIAEANEEDVNMAAKWCIRQLKFPIIFQAVHGVTEKNSTSPSSFNNLEAEVLMWKFLRRLLVGGINGQNTKITIFGI